MAPQQMYTAPESTFQTPAGIPAWRLVMNRLNQYTTAAYAPAQGAAQPNAVLFLFILSKNKKTWYVYPRWKYIEKTLTFIGV